MLMYNKKDCDVLFILPILRSSNRITCIKLIIASFLFDQLIVGTTLDDASLFQYHDTI